MIYRAVIYSYLTMQFLLTYPASCQVTYFVDASSARPSATQGNFIMGHAGSSGKEIKINTRYITLDGKPITPVMGEMQFSRIDKARWEDVILKMKAGGVNIISTYIFWLHHEEIEGQFDWSGNKDLRSFLQLCARYNMWVCLRIGPWVHGEARNGGTPDWILTKKNIVNRSNDVVYQNYVSRWFTQIATHVNGMLYKNDGPVMAVQLENEYTQGRSGEAHIAWLKQTAKHCGLDVPLYTVTGWGDGSVPPGEVIPLWGGYPDQPWTPTLERLATCDDFEFKPFRNDDKIGNALAKKDDTYMDYSGQPYFTCEMGVGVHTTRHRRPVIGKYDGLSMMLSRVGSGSNLLGYYLFAGGSNPRGLLTSLQEDMDETGNWSENPAISYDFQAAISENGMLAPSYYQVKQINYFLNEFGEQLAPLEPVFTKSNDSFQYVVRANEHRAFLFGMNYCRYGVKSIRKDVQFKIKLKNETIIFPSQPLQIPDSAMFIWPVNMILNDITLRYATAQPLCSVTLKTGETAWIFSQNLPGNPEFCFSDINVKVVEVTNGKVVHQNKTWTATGLEPGTNCVITITNQSGTKKKIVLITRVQALQAWLINGNGEKCFFLSPQVPAMNKGTLSLSGIERKQTVYVLPTSNHVLNAKTRSTEGAFDYYTSEIDDQQQAMPQVKQKMLLEDAQWLKTSVDKIGSYNELYHKLFVKEFNLGNPSVIKSALLYIASPSLCRVQINNVWVNQSAKTGQVSALDVTGYVKKHDNILMADFPLETGMKSFAARLVIEYFNTDQVEIVTDASWLTSEQYYYPSPLGTFPNSFAPPVIEWSHQNQNHVEADFGFTEYVILFPCHFKPHGKVFAVFRYYGIRAELRHNHQLVADNFNNGKDWIVHLDTVRSSLECQELKLRIYPIQPSDKILFDMPPPSGSIGKKEIIEANFITEYTNDLKMIDVNSEENN